MPSTVGSSIKRKLVTTAGITTSFGLLSNNTTSNTLSNATMLDGAAVASCRAMKRALRSAGERYISYRVFLMEKGLPTDKNWNDIEDVYRQLHESETEQGGGTIRETHQRALWDDTENAKVDLIQSNSTHLFFAYGREIGVVDVNNWVMVHRITSPLPIQKWCKARLVGLYLVKDTLMALEVVDCHVASSDTSTYTNMLLYEASTLTFRHHETIKGDLESTQIVNGGTRVYVIANARWDIRSLTDKLDVKAIQRSTNETLDAVMYRKLARRVLGWQVERSFALINQTLDCSHFQETSYSNVTKTNFRSSPPPWITISS